MLNQYPCQFNLEDGTNVEVTTKNSFIYQFTVKESTGSNYAFDWHVFRGIEQQPQAQVRILEAYRQYENTQLNFH